MLTLTLSVADEAALRMLYEKQLAQGRAFVPGVGGVEAALAACELVVEHAGRRHVLAAEVVFVKEEEPGKGVGVQLAPLDPAATEALRAFVESCATAEEPVEKPASAGGDAGDEESAADDEPMALRMHERLRALSMQDQQRLAASGTLSERVMLERMYGPTVWETLLRNPRLTIPEAARIGRKERSRVPWSSSSRRTRRGSPRERSSGRCSRTTGRLRPSSSGCCERCRGRTSCWCSSRRLTRPSCARRPRGSSPR